MCIRLPVTIVGLLLGLYWLEDWQQRVTNLLTFTRVPKRKPEPPSLLFFDLSSLSLEQFCDLNSSLWRAIPSYITRRAHQDTSYRDLSKGFYLFDKRISAGVYEFSFYFFQQ